MISRSLSQIIDNIELCKEDKPIYNYQYINLFFIRNKQQNGLQFVKIQVSLVAIQCRRHKSSAILSRFAIGTSSDCPRTISPLKMVSLSGMYVCFLIFLSFSKNEKLEIYEKIAIYNYVVNFGAYEFRLIEKDKEKPTTYMRQLTVVFGTY